eukprot:4341456-Pyramimonas_sp.AAC.1
MEQVGHYIFCTACGSYCAQRLGPKLRATCKPPSSGVLPVSMRRSIANIRDGLHPKTGSKLKGVPPDE